MKNLFMCSAVLLLAVGLATAQDTGGDKAAVTTKPKPKPEVVKTTTHKKGHKGGKKSAFQDDWEARGSGNTSASRKHGTGNDDWEATSYTKGKKGHKGSKKSGKKSTATPLVKPGGPGVPPPTRPTDPK